MKTDALRSVRRRNAAIAAVTMALAVIMLIPAGYGQFSSTLTDEETVGVQNVYVNLSQSGYRNDSRLTTDEITVQYTGFAYEVVSSDNPADTLMKITVCSESRATLNQHDIVKFRVSSTVSGVPHSAGFVLHTTTADDLTPREGEVPFSTSDRTVTAADGQIVESRIDSQTGSGQYVFYLKVTGMKSLPTARASAAATQYIFNGTQCLTQIGGVDYAGKAVVSSKFTATHSTDAGSSLGLTVATTGFTDLKESGWKYVLSVADGSTTQYAYSTNGSTWSYVSGSNMVLTSGTEYDVVLYLAATKAGSLCTTAYAWEDVPRTEGKVIDDGVIILVYDSTYEVD